MRSHAALGKPLADMGLRTTIAAGDFSGVNGVNKMPLKDFHACTLSADEKGAEGAAGTALVPKGGLGPR